MVDIQIAENQFADAVKQLKKIEKQTYDVWSYIGIYKRYAQIGEDKLAEKLLKKALKKNSHNPELIAIYSIFLLRQNRLEEAKKLAEELHGTKYGSIYSEASLKILMNGETADFYKDPKYYSIYYDAYRGSLNPIWIRNCAIFNLKEGRFDTAATLVPSAFADTDDAYFWALVLFDSGKYYESINAIEVSRSFLKDYPDTVNRKLFKVSEIKQIALESDAYMAVSEMESAEAKRQELVCKLDNIDKLSAEDENLLSIIVVNSAVWAKNQYDDDSCADLLFYSVNRWPDNVAALILYSDFAYNSNLEREESLEIKNLRQNGISSVSMEKYDNRRKIPMSDAVYRLEQAMERTKDPYLAIARLDLKYKTDNSFTIKDKTADLWLQMENNYTEEEKYQMLLVQYVLSFLLKTNQKDDAKELFTKYITNTYKFNAKEDFWTQVGKSLSVMDERTAEFAAWFATDEKKFDEALRIYEYCVYESGGILYEGIISPLVSTASCMNLADIYFSTGKKAKALDLYGRAAGRESKNYLRSDVFYRIANIYAADGDNKNALRSVEYSILLYPDNARASLLKEKITQQQQ
jgi:tetratricopeptide (TPR) repeat protein